VLGRVLCQAARQRRDPALSLAKRRGLSGPWSSLHRPITTQRSGDFTRLRSPALDVTDPVVYDDDHAVCLTIADEPEAAFAR
jgi:hypothetical protein